MYSICYIYLIDYCLEYVDILVSLVIGKYYKGVLFLFVLFLL